ncbi:MAG: NusG domain II-containing protein [Acidaminococcaceae bacterium]
MRKNDCLLVLLIVLLAAGLHFFLKSSAADEKLVFEIRHGDEIIQTVKLSALAATGEFAVNTADGTIHIEIDSGKGARITASPCTDKLCIRQGYINKNGQTILCLPEKVMVTAIADKKDGEPDAVLR